MAVIIGGRQFLALASGRRRGRSSRSAGAAAARRQGSREAHAQTAQEAGLCARSAGDRQASVVWSGQDATAIVGSPRAGSAQKQSGREFTSSGSSTRAEDATVQIAGIDATLPARSRLGPEHLQRPTSSCFSQHAPRPPTRSLPELAGSDGGLSSSQVPMTSLGQGEVLVTIPAEQFASIIFL